MSKFVGRLLVEGFCPLCDSIYLLDDPDILDAEFDKEEKPKRIVFHCEECDRNVRAYKFKPVRVSAGYLNNIFYNDDEEES